MAWLIAPASAVRGQPLTHAAMTHHMTDNSRHSATVMEIPSQTTANQTRRHTPITPTTIRRVILDAFGALGGAVYDYGRSRMCTVHELGFLHPTGCPNSWYSV